MDKHIVKLTEKARRKLVAVVTKGRNKASYIQRAHILLKSADGRTDAEIADWLYISESTVRHARLRFGEDGLDAALEDHPKPDRKPLLDEQQEAHLVAIACSDPPDGRARWTLELLTERLMSDGIVESISTETVRLTLKKASQTLVGSSVVYPRGNATVSGPDGSDFDAVCSKLRPESPIGVLR